MVVRVIHGMILLGGRSEKVLQVSLTPDATLADPDQIIANLRREPDECRACQPITLSVQTGDMRRSTTKKGCVARCYLQALKTLGYQHF